MMKIHHEEDAIYDQTKVYDDYTPAFQDVELLSFDIWNTLLTRNAQFSRKRDTLLHQLFLPSQYRGERGIELTHVAVKTANLLVDAIQETKGTQVGPEERLEVVLSQLISLVALDSEDCIPLLETEHNMSNIVAAINDLFLENLPTFINSDVVRIIKFYQGILPVAFVSNTGLIGGAVMRKALPLLDLNPDYLIFSDEIGVAKPQEPMFASLKTLPCVTNPKNILHIGDNLIADVRGAEQAGLSALLFKPSDSFIVLDGDNDAAPAFQRPGEPVTIPDLSNLESIIRCSSTCYANRYLPPIQ